LVSRDSGSVSTGIGSGSAIEDTLTTILRCLDAIEEKMQPLHPGGNQRASSGGNTLATIGSGDAITVISGGSILVTGGPCADVLADGGGAGGLAADVLVGDGAPGASGDAIGTIGTGSNLGAGDVLVTIGVSDTIGVIYDGGDSIVIGGGGVVWAAIASSST
jgi:hypothetical protein